MLNCFLVLLFTILLNIVCVCLCVMYILEAILRLSWTNMEEVHASVFLPAYSIRRSVHVSFSVDLNYSAITSV